MTWTPVLADPLSESLRDSAEASPHRQAGWGSSHFPESNPSATSYQL